MQASTFAIKGGGGASVCDLRKNSRIVSRPSQCSTRNSKICLTYKKSNSLVMGAELTCARVTVAGAFMSSIKGRFLKARASSGGDLEDFGLVKPEEKSSGTVLPYVAVACLGAILFGYHLGVVNGALEYLAKDLGIAEDTVLQGWVVSTLLAGATVGSFTGGSLADKFGRTRTFQLDAIPLAVGAFLCATAQSVQTMIIGRVLVGIGIGISSALVPLYISEISPTEIRGALGSVNQLFICVGILAALVAGLPLATNPLWWRTMFGVALVPSVLLAFGMGFSPESPRWLFQQGRISEAEAAIKTLWGKERVAEVIHDLRAGSQGSTEPEAGWLDLFSTRYWKGGRDDMPINFIPGIPSNIQFKDLPREVASGNLDSIFSRLLHKMGQTVQRGAAVALNSFEELDPSIIKDFNSKFHRCLAVGPIALTSPSSVSSDQDPKGCIPWLDTQKMSSVAYISFGTITTPPPQELIALAEALEQSGVAFLWSLKDHVKSQLPSGFLDRTSHRGLVVPWAPQPKVLQHASLGVFVTHCGWNSVIESITGGVPMICRPFFGDQPFNGQLVSKVWGIGVGAKNGILSKDGLIEAFDLILSKDEGKKMRENVLVLKDLAKQAVGPQGSSTKNFNTLVDMVITTNSVKEC